MSKNRARVTGGNPARTSAVQRVRASGASGPHKQPSDRTRAEIEREAIEDSYDPAEEV